MEPVTSLANYIAFPKEEGESIDAAGGAPVTPRFRRPPEGAAVVGILDTPMLHFVQLRRQAEPLMSLTKLLDQFHLRCTLHHPHIVYVCS